jgi:hypothetical protein
MRMGNPRFVFSIMLLVTSACRGGEVAPQGKEPSVRGVASGPAALARPSGTAAAARAAPRPAKDYKLDGFALGTPYGSAIQSRAPYKEPCDDDAIDKRARRFMVYGAKPCRDKTFPEDTTVAFYLSYVEGPTEFEQPVLAFAWLGGNYFASRSDFPLKVGEPKARATEIFGPPEKTFTLERKGIEVSVESHSGDVHVVIDGEVICGFVLGPMPPDGGSEQWRALMQMYQRYTNRVGARSASSN